MIATGNARTTQAPKANDVQRFLIRSQKAAHDQLMSIYKPCKGDR